jgi:prepilin peptidase CpaA
MIIFLIIYLFALITALSCGVLAAWSDFKGMIIPNKLSLIIVGCFALAFVAANMANSEALLSLGAHLWAGGLTLAVTAGMFFARIFGGGDSKLISAYALWVGTVNIMALLFYVALLGAVIAAVSLAIKKYKPFKQPVLKALGERSWIARVQAGEGVVPYGIPIMIGAVCAFIHAGYISPEILSTFF